MHAGFLGLGPAAIALFGFVSAIGGLITIYGMTLLHRRINSDHRPQGF